KVIEAFVRTISLPHSYNALCKFCFKTSQVNEADINVISVNGREIGASVNTRSVNHTTASACLMEVKFCLVKSAKVVDHDDHKLQRVVSFQIHALTALHGVARGMPLRKRITRKAFDLMPHALDYVFRIAFPPAIFKKAISYSFKFLARSNLSRHPASENI